MFAVVDLFLRNRCSQTKYYWLPAAKIEEGFVPSNFRSFSKNDFIVQLNGISIAALPPENRNMMLGFNQYEYTEKLDAKQYLDAVHLVDSHYSHIAGKLMEEVKVQLDKSEGHKVPITPSSGFVIQQQDHSLLGEIGEVGQNQSSPLVILIT